MMLGICLRGEARVELASLDEAQRRSNHAVSSALAHSFVLKEIVHLYQAELKAHRKKGDESMANLGRDTAKLVRMAYPTVDTPTRGDLDKCFFRGLPPR